MKNTKATDDVASTVSPGGQSGAGQVGQTQTPLSTNEPPVQTSTDHPSDSQSVSFWEHYRRGEPAAYSALASMVALACTIIIAGLTLRLSKAIRRSQIAQEQVRMVLEIDSELIKSPELWVVHGQKYKLVPEPTSAAEESLLKALESNKETEKNASAALNAIRTQPQTSGSSPRPAETTSGKQYTLKQLRELALLTRYFNMFDFVYSTSGRSWFRWLFPQQRQEWMAWKNYMRDFFDKNVTAKTTWDDLSKLGIYAESFRLFVNNEVIGKPPEQQGTWQPLRKVWSWVKRRK